MFLKYKIILFFIFIFSCQPIEILTPAKINYDNFPKLSIGAKEISINLSYNPVFSKENIEDQLTISPLVIINTWNSKNIKKFGNENKFIINILDASILKKEINNPDAKKYEEQKIFKYEVFFLIEYQLFDNNDFLIANTIVESSRSTTSQKYISLNETEIIIFDLMNNSLKDFTKEAVILLNKYMGQYLFN